MKQSRSFLHLFPAVLCLVTVSLPSGAQPTVPMLINYQGELRSPTSGSLVPDGFYDMVLRIYDAESAGDVVWQGTHSGANGNPVQVKNGTFSVILGSGNGNALDRSVFSGAERWLEIEVGTEKLSPRQRVTSVPYSMVGLGGAQVIEDYTGGSVLSVVNTYPEGEWFWPVAGWFETRTGAAVVGLASGSGATNHGGYFEAYGTSGVGVQGQSYGEMGTGVIGYAWVEGGTGVLGEASSGVGVEGRGPESGVKGTTNDSSGVGVVGENWSTDSYGYLAGTYGVYGQASTTAVWGHNTSNGNFGYLGGEHGVYGVASDEGNVRNHGGYFVAKGMLGTGVHAEAPEYGGNFVASGERGWGVYAKGSENGGRFFASGDSGVGVWGHGQEAGVEGEGTVAGVKGTGAAAGGLFSVSREEAIGVYAESSGVEGIGVRGQASDKTYGKTNYGGYFTASGSFSAGVYGEALCADHNCGGHFKASGENSYAVKGEAAQGIGGSFTGQQGIFASGEGGYAGGFCGNVDIWDGDLTVENGSKKFVQPHPADPAKEIVYVCLEGGENGVYVRGSGQLENGRAELDLPEHFGLVAAEEGLTAQITPRDGKARGYLYVEEASPDHIIVVESGGGTSDAQFDYLVMGVRRGFEEHQVIQENTLVQPDENMSQEEYEERMASPKRRGLQKILIENGTLTPEGKINQETARRLGWKLGPKTKAERLEKMSPGRPETDKKNE